MLWEIVTGTSPRFGHDWFRPPRYASCRRTESTRSPAVPIAKPLPFHWPIYSSSLIATCASTYVEPDWVLPGNSFVMQTCLLDCSSHDIPCDSLSRANGHVDGLIYGWQSRQMLLSSAVRKFDLASLQGDRLDWHSCTRVVDLITWMKGHSRCTLFRVPRYTHHDEHQERAATSKCLPLPGLNGVPSSS